MRAHLNGTSNLRHSQGIGPLDAEDGGVSSSPRDWQTFYLQHPTPDPHALSATLVNAARQSQSAKLPIQLGVANAVVLTAAVIAAVKL